MSSVFNHRRSFVFGMLSVSAALLASCGGSTEPVPVTAPVRPPQRASLGWTMDAVKQADPRHPQSQVYLTITDETGRGTNSLIGTYDGVCTLIPAGEIHDVVTAVRCWWNNRGVELHAVAQRSQVIILRQPVAQGVATDPMARDEFTRFTIPTGAAIVAAPKN